MRKVEIIKPAEDIPIKRIKVAAYARVSVDAEMSEHSFQAQVSYYSNLIKHNLKWVCAGIFTDYGLTGTKADRPGFQSMIKECDNGNVDMILVKSISRFCRNTVDLLNTVRHLKDINVNVRFEKENIDSISSEGELMLSLFASFAQEESRSISENVTWSIRKRFEKGIGNSYVVYGYKWNGTGFDIVPKQAEIVKEIFGRYLDGETPDGIANDLKNRGIKSTFGKPFCYSQVCGILRLEKYTGNSMLQKTYRENHITKKKLKNHGELPRYFAEETHTQIIDQDTFDVVQEEIARRAQLGFLANRKLAFSPFTHKVVCSKCGHTYRRRMNKSRRSMNPYYRWVCGTKIKGTSSACNSNNIPETALYGLTSDVLGINGFTKEQFDKAIDHITVNEKNTLVFHMTDGSQEPRQWICKSGSGKYWRDKKHGKECNGNTGNADQVLVTAYKEERKTQGGGLCPSIHRP